MTGRRLFTVLTLAAGLLVGAVASLGPARAQEISLQRIAAVVNDEVITERDLRARVKLIALTSRVPYTPENRARLRPQLLRKLIVEKLQIQEARRLGYEITESDLSNGIQMIEQRSSMPPGSFVRFLAENDIDMGTVRAQLRGDISWIKVVENAIRPTVKIGEEEVDNRLEQLQSALSQPRLLMAEIYLPIDATVSEREVEALAERLYTQIRQGAAFPVLAKQFSQAPTAAVGGDTGWVPLSQLAPEIRQAVEGLDPGQLAPPVKTFNGYTIVMLRDRRAPAVAADIGETTLELSQLYMPVESGSGGGAVSPERAAEITARAKETTDCAAFNALAEEYGLIGSGGLGRIKVKNLPEAIRGDVAAMPVNRASDPLAVQGGRSVVMVCDREEPNPLPSREEVRDMLIAERVDMLAQRRLRDLQRRALIDIRL